MTASGQEIEKGGTGNCKCTLGSISLSHLFHAQNFGKFTVSGGELTQSTFTAEGNIALAEVDGVAKSSDLVGGKITISGTIVGVNNGALSRPTITLTDTTGTLTQPISETNPNGQFPTYSFTAEWPLKADTASH